MDSNKTFVSFHFLFFHLLEDFLVFCHEFQLTLPKGAAEVDEGQQEGKRSRRGDDKEPDDADPKQAEGPSADDDEGVRSLVPRHLGSWIATI